MGEPLGKWLVGMLALAMVICMGHAVGWAEDVHSLLGDLDTGRAETYAEPVSYSSSYADLAARVAALEAAADEREDTGWMDMSGERFGVHIGGRIFGDYVNFVGQDLASRAAFGKQPDYYEMRSIRLFCEGEGYGVFDYRMEFDLEPENGGAEAVAMRDMYVGIRELPILGYLRVGNFWEPFSLEQQTRLEHTTFMERALPNVLVPGRHVGLCCYNHTANDRFTIAYGAFFDRANIDYGPITDDASQVVKQVTDSNQGIDIPIRVTCNPIYRAGGRGVLHAGGGVVWTNDRDNLLSFTATPEVHEANAHLSTGLLAMDSYYRANFELAGVYGPFSLQSEVFYVHGDAPPGFFDRDLYGAYVYGSWFLTGENRVYNRRSGSFGRVTPNTNFWMVRTARGRCTGLGAWELAARWSYLELQGLPGIGPLEGQMNDVTLGVNWYWNPQMRLMCNYIHSYGAVNAVPGVVANTDVLALRLQVDF